jgi:predicted RNA-binding protein (virulence factor B family)
MIEIGKHQLLTVNREVDFGLYLGDGNEEILLPTKYVPDGLSIGDKLRVFVYKDSEDRPIATTLQPAGEVGSIVSLKVKDSNPHGAFMDWGLEKDLFVPKREQHVPFQLGKFYVVRILLDHKTNRLIGTSKIRAFLKKDAEGLEEGQKVSLLIYSVTDLGFQAVINGIYSGLLYRSECPVEFAIGTETDGYIRAIREDGKIDLRLSLGGRESADEHREMLLDALQKNEGYLSLTDKSSPEAIQQTLGMSKKAFKKALGNLYRERLVLLESEGVRLAASDDKA